MFAIMKMFALLALVVVARGENGFNVTFTPAKPAQMSSMTLTFDVPQGITIGGGGDNTVATIIKLSLSKAIIGVNIGGMSHVTGTGPFAAPAGSKQGPFFEEKRLNPEINIWAYGGPNITGVGNTTLEITITNVLLWNSCEDLPLNSYRLSVMSTLGNTWGALDPKAPYEYPQRPGSDISYPAAITATPITGCQTGPQISSAAVALSTPESTAANSTALDLGRANITVTDATPGSPPLVVLVGAQRGTITLNGTSPGITVDPTPFALRLEGQQGPVNAALQKLLYTPNKDFNGLDNITITAHDHDWQGPGPAAGDVRTLSVNVTAVDSPVEIRLRSADGYAAGSWFDDIPTPVVIQDRDASVVHVQITSTRGKFALVNGPSPIVAAAHSLSGTVAELNAVLATLTFKSSGQVECNGYQTGSLNVSAQPAAGRGANASFPVYILSAGAADGCGTDGDAWADFTPTSALTDQKVKLTIVGFKAYTMRAGLSVAVALSYSEECMDLNFTSPNVFTGQRDAPQDFVGLLAVDVDLRNATGGPLATGPYTVCYWSYEPRFQMDAAQGVLPFKQADFRRGNIHAMQRKLTVYNASQVAENALFAGYTTCGAFIQHQRIPIPGLCGCLVQDNSTTTTATEMGTFAVPLDFPADSLLASGVPLKAVMGCCNQPTNMTKTMSLNPTQSWGYCTDSTPVNWARQPTSCGLYPGSTCSSGP
mmetsp:Transcript_11584/g.20932  ORF Transcript_11584/g.20932 Transcript_11584/m.20932 type:complete len:710 (-) Transcript_11584:772-2901(-)